MIHTRPFLLAALLLVPQASSAQLPAALQSAEALATSVEAAERDPALATMLDAELTLGAVEAELAGVRSYLATSPEDPDALMLTVRLGRVRDLLVFRDAVTAMFTNPEAAPPEPPDMAPLLATLDALLERTPSLATAHYWKARLLVEDAAHRAQFDPAAVPAGGNDPGTTGTAATEARSAVELDPANAVHREFLAGLLLADGDLDGAQEVLSDPSTSGQLMQLLVADLQAFAPPPPAVLDDVLTSFALMVTMMSAGDSEDPVLARYVELRGLGWSSPESTAEVEGYYRERWPDIRFFAADGWEGASAAAFVPADGGWVSVSREEDFRAADQAMDSGVLLLVLPSDTYGQMRDQARSQGLPDILLLPGDRVGVLVINSRR